MVLVTDRLRVRRSWAIAVACIGLAFFGLAGRAAAATGGIHGTVTSAETAAPVDNYRVDLYDSAKAQVATTCTAADGTYSFSGLGTADFYVSFSGKTGCGAPTDFAPEWWAHHFAGTLANAIPVTDGLVSTGIDASLRAGAQVLGTVTDAATTLPVANVTVQVHDNFGSLLTSVCSAADGTYTANRLAPGVDTVAFISDGGCGAVAGYQTQYYNDAATFAAAAPVDIAQGATVPNIDAHLVMPGGTPPPGGGGGGTPPPSGGGGTPPPSGSAPTCSLRVNSAKVVKPGRLRLTFHCNQAATLSLSGTVTERIPKRGHTKAKTKRFRVKAAHATASAGRNGTMTVTLPAGALSALRKHRRESVAFTLTATGAHGRSHATASVARLR